tara:strand:- start:187 stop:555 length:369 start_codon:yes stop_codon:yes gene_type:complete
MNKFQTKKIAEAATIAEDYIPISKQYVLKEDMPITFAEGAKMLNLNIVTLHIAAKKGKLKCTQVGQGGWGCKRKYNNETTYGDLKEWRSKVRPRRKSTTININKEIRRYISHYTNQGQKKRA